MSGNDEGNENKIEHGDLTEEDIGNILTVIATDGYYKQATM